MVFHEILCLNYILILDFIIIIIIICETGSPYTAETELMIILS